MSNKPADLAAAPVEYFGIKLHPLRIMDWGALDRWLKQCVMDDAIATARRNQLDGEYLTAIMVAAQKLAERTSTATIEGMSKLNSFEGFLKIIELASRGSFTESIRNDLLEKNMQNAIEQASNAVLTISQPDAEIDDEPGTKKKTTKE